MVVVVSSGGGCGYGGCCGCGDGGGCGGCGGGDQGLAQVVAW